MTSDMSEDTANNAASIQTIFIVEDDDAISDFLVRLIEQETSYKALHATDATQALHAVSSIKPSLFILDYHLPGIDGLELHDRLHSIKGLETVPTLMVSATFPSRRALQERQILFIKKPFELSDLLNAIEKVVARQNNED
ncbi:MAG: hypothetical protein NVS3B14_17150 [Ktedonobacteraceae bacterium]